jgi:hypothetical protein
MWDYAAEGRTIRVDLCDVNLPIRRLRVFLEIDRQDVIRIDDALTSSEER